jgi:NitT/TauT family transport system substrate-binding protein
MLQRTHFAVRRSLGLFGVSLAVAAVISGGARGQSAEPVDATRIVIGQGSTGPSSLPLYVAVQQDFFKKAGLDVTAQTLSGGTPSAMASFATGAVNILNLSAPELIQYTGKKVISGKVFGEINDQQYDIVVAKDLTSIKDIKGKTIGISAPNSGDQIYLLALMQHEGISPNDVTFISTGNPINRLAALSAGSIQVTAAPNAQREESVKAGSIILKSGDSPVQFPNTIFFANDDLIKNHKPLLKKVLTTLAAATEWIRTNREAAVAACAKTLGATAEACTSSIKLSFDKSVSSNFTWSSTYAVNVEGIKSALAVMASVDPDTKGVTIDDIVDTSIAGTTP